ncbi:MAG: hypothetical protein AAB217_11565 [Chloroflexota bacterium]|mgnify:CR=1 FL=1
MNARKLLADFVITFGVALVVTVLVTFLWSLVFHGAGAVDWETSFRFAIIFGIVFPLSRAWESQAAVK